MRRMGLAVVLVSLVLAPLAAAAQQMEKVRRIGFISGAVQGSEVEDAFRQGLHEHRYIEGQNLLVEWRFAEGRNDRLPGYAEELVSLKVEVIATLAPAAALAAKKATATIPIVFTLVPDPVALGVVSSLARPGGNITGFSQLSVELIGKRLQLLKEAVSSLKSAAILTDSANPTNALAWKEAQIAARKLGLETRLVEVRNADQLEPAFTTMAREPSCGILLVPSSFLVSHGIRIAELAMKNRLPVLGWTGSGSSSSQNGVLVSYGPSTSDILRRAGGYVAKILNGAKPADLPV